MTYLDRAPKYQVAQVVARNLTNIELSKLQYQGKTQEELSKLNKKFYTSNYFKLVEETKEELLARKKALDDRKKKPQTSEENLDKQRIETLVQNPQDSLQ